MRRVQEVRRVVYPGSGKLVSVAFTKDLPSHVEMGDIRASVPQFFVTHEVMSTRMVQIHGRSFAKISDIEQWVLSYIAADYRKQAQDLGELLQWVKELGADIEEPTYV